MAVQADVQSGLEMGGRLTLDEIQCRCLPHLVSSEPLIFDNARIFVQSNTFPPEENRGAALSLSHADPWLPQGNGHHARTMVDPLVEKLVGKPCTWDGSSLQDAGALREVKRMWLCSRPRTITISGRC